MTDREREVLTRLQELLRERDQARRRKDIAEARRLTTEYKAYKLANADALQPRY